MSTTSLKSYPPNPPRVRTRGGFQGAQTVYQVASGPVDNSTSSFGVASPQGVLEVMTDHVSPDFKRRIANGEVIFNPMEKVSESLIWTSIGPEVTQNFPPDAVGQRYTLNGAFWPSLFGQSTLDAKAIPLGLRPPRITTLPIDRAIAEASTQAQRPPSKANLLVTLAEIDKTVRLVPDLLHNWKNLFEKLNRVAERSRNKSLMENAKGLSKSNLRALERSLTETWLAMRFGVRPLIMDTLGVIEAIRGQYLESAVRLTQRGTSKALADDITVSPGGLGVIRIQTQIVTSNIVNVRAMNLWEVRLDLLRNAGVSLANIPEAAVDLLRFSFVLNWVVNVNDYFAALGAMMDPGLKSMGGCFVLNEEYSRTWQPIATESTHPYYDVSRSCSGLISSTVNKTSRVVGLKAPQLVVRASPLKFLTDARLIDATALLRQQTRGRGVRILGNSS